MPEIEIHFPTLHDSQAAAYGARSRFFAVRCGRRWGKTELALTMACDRVVRGQRVGWFAPSYKYIPEVVNEAFLRLAPIRKSSSRVEGAFRAITGGLIDFWTLEDDRAGRSRFYDLIVIDEAAFTKKNMIDIWRNNLRPTLIDTAGSVIVISNTNGKDPENFFYAICEEPKFGFTQFHATTHDNPLLPEDEKAGLADEFAPLAYQQEILAEFVDWSGSSFFDAQKFLVDGEPVEYPAVCGEVFATIDTAMKEGREHDGTAVTYWARSLHFDIPLIALDWEILSIDGALLEAWLPSVYQTLEGFARETRARHGSLGAFIEDAQSGTVLLQQARRRGWPATAIDSKLTVLGKEGRALSVSGYVHREMVKISRRAYDKTMTFKGHTRNHWWSQVVGFRIGVKREAEQQDDLLDTATYGMAIALGNPEGF